MGSCIRSYSSSISLGSGDDNLHITSTGESFTYRRDNMGQNLSAAYGVNDSFINAGSGNDSLFINVSSKNTHQNSGEIQLLTLKVMGFLIHR